MSNIAMLLVCLLAGIILRISGRIPDKAHSTLNSFIIHIGLPCLILGQIHGLRLSSELAWPVMMPWLLFSLSAGAFWALARATGLAPATTGALILTAGLANTSFVGLPMIETFYGPQGLPTGIMIDQLGSYLVLSTLGIVVAAACSEGSASGRTIATRVVTFPPLIALVFAFALMDVSYPPWLASLFHRLGDTLAPLALVSVGSQLRLDQFAGNRAALGVGLAFKLIVGPLVIALLYFGVLQRHGETAQITVFESAMGPMIGGAIVALQYNLNPALITLMVGVGIALSFVTLPVWWWALEAI